MYPPLKLCIRRTQKKYKVSCEPAHSINSGSKIIDQSQQPTTIEPIPTFDVIEVILVQERGMSKCSCSIGLKFALSAS